MKSLGKKLALLVLLATVALPPFLFEKAFAQSGLGGLGEVPFTTIRFGLECRDRIDNNGNGRADLNDPNCVNANDSSEFLPGTQAQTISLKDIDCDGREDVLGISLVNFPVLKTLVRETWGTLLCPSKVDRNCDGYSDLTSTAVVQEPHHEYQCPNGFPQTPEEFAEIDANCDGIDDKYPVYVRNTSYWSVSCREPQLPGIGKIADTNCDGYEDTFGNIDLLTPARIEVWRSLCPNKVDQNCDGYAEINGLAYWADFPQQPTDGRTREGTPMYPAGDRSEGAINSRISKAQCPSAHENGYKQGRDLNCDGYEDVPFRIDTVIVNGQQKSVPVYMDLTTTAYWKQQCVAKIRGDFQDADCNGLDDRKELNIDILGSGFLKEWRKLCPGKVDRNCDGRVDATGQRSSGEVDKKGNEILLTAEPHHKYQCPGGISIQDRDRDCDGFDDTHYRDVRTEAVLGPDGVLTGESRDVEYIERVDLTKTDYWKGAIYDSKGNVINTDGSNCAEAAGGALGSSPFSPYGGNTDSTGAKKPLVCSEVGLRFDSFEAIVCTITNLVARIFLPFAFVIATLFFIYGVIKYFMAAASSKDREEGRKFMVWSILALFVMVSIWGILKLGTDTLGFKFLLPQLKVK